MLILYSTTPEFEFPGCHQTILPNQALTPTLLELKNHFVNPNPK